MSVPQEPDSFEFADYLGVLRRRWWVVLALACVCVLASGAYVALAAKAYTATATVDVTATGITQGGAVAGGRTSSAVNLDTEAQIVHSSTVAAIAARAMHSPLPPTALLSHVSVAVPANSSVLQISCKAPFARQAAACANAFGAAYLRNRSASAAGMTHTELGALQDQLTTLEKKNAELAIQIQSLPTNSAQRASAQAQLETASSQLRALASQAASLSAQGAASSGGSIITTATPPAKPSSPKKLIAIPSGLLAGLLVGLIAAFAWDRRDTRIKDARDVERSSSVPVLLSLSPADLDGEPLVLARSAAGLAFTELARSTAAALGKGNHLLLVAGASPGHTAGVVAANLAVTLARRHSAVILVCPSQQGTPELLGLAEIRSLDTEAAAELAAGDITLDDVALEAAGHPGLRVSILAADLYDLQDDHARHLVSQLRRNAEYVVVEAQPPGTGADSFTLAEYCDAAVVAVEISRTRRPDIEGCIRGLIRLGTQVLGVAAVPRLHLPANSPRVRDIEKLPVAPGEPWADSAMAEDEEGKPASSAQVHAETAERLSGN